MHRSRRTRPLKGHILLDERSERRLRRIRWRRMAIALAAVMAVTGAIAVYWSPLLRVQEVQIVGTANVDAGQAAQLADLTGQSMLRLDLGAAEARIEALPLVKTVEAKRRWPHTIRIEVNERLPWGYWRMGDTTYVIDSEGVILPDLPALQPPPGAPLIDDLSSPVDLQPGDQVDEDAVALARSILELVPQALALGISGMEYTPQRGLSLSTDSGYNVVLGDSQNLDYKLAVWQAIEKELGRAAMTGHILDLRFQDRPSLQ